MYNGYNLSSDGQKLSNVIIEGHYKKNRHCKLYSTFYKRSLINKVQNKQFTINYYSFIMETENIKYKTPVYRMNLYNMLIFYINVNCNYDKKYTDNINKLMKDNNDEVNDKDISYYFNQQKTNCFYFKDINNFLSNIVDYIDDMLYKIHNKNLYIDNYEHYDDYKSLKEIYEENVNKKDKYPYIYMVLYGLNEKLRNEINEMDEIYTDNINSFIRDFSTDYRQYAKLQVLHFNLDKHFEYIEHEIEILYHFEKRKNKTNSINEKQYKKNKYNTIKNELKTNIKYEIITA